MALERVLSGQEMTEVGVAKRSDSGREDSRGARSSHLKPTRHPTLVVEEALECRPKRRRRGCTCARFSDFGREVWFARPDLSARGNGRMPV